MAATKQTGTFPPLEAFVLWWYVPESAIRSIDDEVTQARLRDAGFDYELASEQFLTWPDGRLFVPVTLTEDDRRIIEEPLPDRDLNGADWLLTYAEKLLRFAEADILFYDADDKRCVDSLCTTFSPDRWYYVATFARSLFDSLRAWAREMRLDDSYLSSLSRCCTGVSCTQPRRPRCSADDFGRTHVCICELRARVEDARESAYAAGWMPDGMPTIRETFGWSVPAPMAAESNGAATSPPWPSEHWYDARWYKHHTGDGLYPDLLKRAGADNRIRRKKHGGRNHYELGSVCDQYPQYTQMLRRAHEGRDETEPFGTERN